jgi:tetratricopeptide (TPR) repeat protein
MLVINPYLRFALIALSLIGGIALWATAGVWYGIWFVIVGIVLLVGYILLGTVSPAAKALQATEIDKAEKLLNLTLSPKLLYVTNRAYYYMLKGSIAIARKDTDEGEKWLKIAESIDVPTDNEKAMLQIQLANIAGSKNKWKQAQIHFRNAKQLKITDSNIKGQLKELEKAFANQGQVKAAGRMGKGGAQMMRPGGKRRRPKMR